MFFGLRRIMQYAPVINPYIKTIIAAHQSLNTDQTAGEAHHPHLGSESQRRARHRAVKNHLVWHSISPSPQYNHRTSPSRPRACIVYKNVPWRTDHQGPNDQKVILLI